MHSPVIVALDFPDQQPVFEILDKIDPTLCRVKIGKELFTRYGPELVRAVQTRGYEVFLDLKFHDIPTTVAGAVKAAADLGVWMVNVHAQGGAAMLHAAAEALDNYGDAKPILTGVTVLTSMTDTDLATLGIHQSAQQYALFLAEFCQQAGLDGVVCSSQEAIMMRQAFGKDFKLVTPGIRPEFAPQNDQKRVMTPREAVAAGVDYLVIGRPITQAQDPESALQQILDQLSD